MPCKDQKPDTLMDRLRADCSVDNFRFVAARFDGAVIIVDIGPCCPPVGNIAACQGRLCRRSAGIGQLRCLQVGRIAACGNLGQADAATVTEPTTAPVIVRHDGDLASVAADLHIGATAATGITTGSDNRCAITHSIRCWFKGYGVDRGAGAADLKLQESRDDDPEFKPGPG